MFILHMQYYVDCIDADKVANIAQKSVAKLLRNVLYDMFFKRVLEECRVRTLITLIVSDFLMDLKTEKN